MFYREKSFYFAVATLIGTTIGVGIFGIPYAVAHAGFFIGFLYIIVLGVVVVFLQLMYAEVILRTKKRHRFIGYAKIYLGEFGKYVSSIIILFGFPGSLLAYMIIGGRFLNTLLSGSFGGTQFFYSMVFFSVSSVLILLGLKLVARGELFMTIFLLFTVSIIFLKGLPHIEMRNLVYIDLENFFLPYGVVLFAMGAIASIPEVVGVLSRKRKFVKPAIIIGTLVPIIVYICFAFVVVGVTGLFTSQEAIEGLKSVFGDGVISIGSLFGFLAVATSFLVIGLNFKENLWFDYKLSHLFSWLIAMGIPLILFLLAPHDFIKIISLVGGIIGGMSGILVVLMYWKAKENGDRKPEYVLRFPRWLSYMIIGVFVAGIVYEILYQL